ncbi:hypothetical protein [Pseudodesulfovibrio sp.]|uniref:hypothetical protein n=1 Tax=Pseudodesulfovibrio sp. TaxID=2035812 RepID=UPI002630A1E1|nr:hypothetical protein [Pseudodesulfovibrio sp.]MDD3312684.1 hypothetical protein [Pseudodesulfovibrio sp.]
MQGNTLKTLLAGLVLGLFPLLQGCPALIIVAIAYSGEDYATVTVEIPRSADMVFDHALKLSDEGVEAATGEPYTVEKVARANYFMRITAKDGSWWLELNLVPLDGRSCQLIMTGRSPGDLEAQKHRGLVAVERLCDDLGVRYRVVENPS